MYIDIHMKDIVQMIKFRSHVMYYKAWAYHSYPVVAGILLASAESST